MGPTSGLPRTICKACDLLCHLGCWPSLRCKVNHWKRTEEPKISTTQSGFWLMQIWVIHNQKASWFWGKRHWNALYIMWETGSSSSCYFSMASSGESSERALQRPQGARKFCNGSCWLLQSCLIWFQYEKTLHVSWDQTQSGSPCCFMYCAHCSWDISSFITQEFRNRYKFTRSATNRWCLWLAFAVFLEGSTGLQKSIFLQQSLLAGVWGFGLFSHSYCTLAGAQWT